MYKKGTGNDKQGKDAGNRTLVPYRNFSQAINFYSSIACFRVPLHEPDLDVNLGQLTPCGTKQVSFTC